MQKKISFGTWVSISILLILAVLTFFVSPKNATLLNAVEQAFNDNPAKKVLVSEVVKSDWDSACVDTTHMPKDIIEKNMQGVVGYTKPPLRVANIFYAGSLYFIKDKKVVEEYEFNTLGRGFDLKPLSINVDGQKYLFFGESFFEENACKSRNEAQFVTYVDESFGEPYRKIMFTSK